MYSLYLIYNKGGEMQGREWGQISNLDNFSLILTIEDFIPISKIQP